MTIYDWSFIYYYLSLKMGLSFMSSIFYHDIFGEVQFTPFSFQYIAENDGFSIYNIKDD